MNYERLLIALGLLIIASVAYYYISDNKPPERKTDLLVCYIMGALPAYI